MTHVCGVCHESFTKRDEWAHCTLTSIISDATPLERPVAAESIAGWCYRLCIVHDLTNADPLIPADQRRAFRERGELPGSVRVWVGRFRWGTDVRFEGRMLLIGSGEQAQVYVYTARLGYFLFQVVGVVEGHLELPRRHAADLVQVWPPHRADGMAWLPPSTPPIDTERFIQAHRLGFTLPT